MIIFFSVVIILVLFFVIYFRLYLYLFPKNRLTILMYHKVEEQAENEMTVSKSNLEEQFRYLQEKKYKSIFFSEIHNLKARNIILTFDDGYKDNYDFLPSLLAKYNLKAVIFVTTKFIEENAAGYQMMTFEELRSLNKDFFEIGLHSHAHENFLNLNLEVVKEDLLTNMAVLDREKISYSKVFAYPFGRYQNASQFFDVLKDVGIQYGLRIGNKLNYFPSKKPFKLCRIDVKGSDDLSKFKQKLIFGKLKIF